LELIVQDKDELRRLINEKFNESELRNLYFDLDIGYDDFSSGGKLDKVRELILWAERNSQDDNLISKLEIAKPGVLWRRFIIGPPVIGPPIGKRNPRQIFMSYAHQDEAFTRRLANDLKTHNWEIWMAPDKIKPGDPNWVATIDRGLAESGKLLLILTPDAAKSINVQAETNAAIEHKNYGAQLDILPIEVKPVSPIHLPHIWLPFQRVKFPEDYKIGLENVMNALQPDKMSQLKQLYSQLEQVFARKEWGNVVQVCQKIIEDYPDYRETMHMMSLAERSAKREALLQIEAESYYQQLQKAIALKSWDEALRLIEHIEKGIKNYKDVTDLEKIIRKNRRRDTFKRIFQPGSMKKFLFWIGGILVISLAVWGLWAAFDNAGETDIPPAKAELGDRWTRPTDEMEMAFVPGGTFMMGSAESDTNAGNDEKPQHEVTLDSYWIDRTEVTNTQFAAFLNMRSNREEGGVTWLEIDDKGVLIELEGNRFVSKPGFAEHPVNNVSWYGAEAYCQWVGGQLPTEAQWEYAARGSNGRLYPWGNEEPTCELAQFMGCSGDSISVGSFSPDGDSWVETADMAGNVWEWVADWYASDYYENAPTNNPIRSESGDIKVVRGGGWLNIYASNLRVADRSYGNPDARVDNIGFRCVLPPGS
jgi:formylglycine-generating enzyme required for sulfatase activity